MAPYFAVSNTSGPPAPQCWGEPMRPSVSPFSAQHWEGKGYLFPAGARSARIAAGTRTIRYCSGLSTLFC